MGTSYLQLESGLVVPQEGSGWATIQAALKRHDQHLELGQVAGVWKVYYRYGSEQNQVEFLCDWRDPDGTPRELSHGLVEKVQGLDRNSREKALSADRLNQLRAEKLAKHKADVTADLINDYAAKHGRPVLPRSRSLMRARHKSGYHDWKV